ncbi:gp669 [Bacillus phage G]|uniref:Gp669 n=1 Tax=Bacillus phage G TaxID=2884420 RepID=G3MB49_9CAUD|nr:gp669 [Bacillus phage G]AEO93912.1 gp669 [Bacillus phage G]
MGNYRALSDTLGVFPEGKVGIVKKFSGVFLRQKLTLQRGEIDIET